MNHLVPVSLCLGLTLTACERQRAGGDADAGNHGAATPLARRGHAPREALPGSSGRMRADLKAAEKLTLAADREKAIAELAWNAMETHPALFAEAFSKLPPDSPQRLRLIQHQAILLAASDPEEALAWADGLDSGLETSAAKVTVALTLAESDPLRAADMISEFGIEGRESEVALVQVIQRWAGKDPAGAVSWVVSFPAGPARNAGFRVVAEQWLSLDAASAFGWAEGLPAGEMRNGALTGMREALWQQPEEIREAWLNQATPGLRSELRRQEGQAVELGEKDVSAGSE